MSIQTAFRKVFEPFLSEYGFVYWKKGFYRYDPAKPLICGLRMTIDSAKRDLLTYIEIGGFVDRLSINREGEGLDSMHYLHIEDHPLYAQLTDNSHDRMRVRKVGNLSICDDLGPYNDESATEQFQKQKEFIAEYLLQDCLDVRTAQDLFEMNWKTLEPLYAKDPDMVFTYPPQSERVMYEAIQVGNKDVALQTAARMVYAKENRYLSALHRDYPNEQLTRESQAEFEKMQKVYQAILADDIAFLNECLAERIEITQNTCQSFFRRFPAKAK